MRNMFSLSRRNCFPLFTICLATLEWRHSLTFLESTNLLLFSHKLNCLKDCWRIPCWWDSNVYYSHFISRFKMEIIVIITNLCCANCQEVVQMRMRRQNPSLHSEKHWESERKEKKKSCNFLWSSSKSLALTLIWKQSPSSFPPPAPSPIHTNTYSPLPAKLNDCFGHARQQQRQQTCTSPSDTWVYRCFRKEHRPFGSKDDNIWTENRLC